MFNHNRNANLRYISVLSKPGYIRGVLSKANLFFNFYLLNSTREAASTRRSRFLKKKKKRKK